MIDLATCSYKEFKPEMGVPVRTSLGVPRWRLSYEHDWQNHQIREIAPTGRIFKEPDDAVFERLYLEHLEGVGVERIQQRINAVHAHAGQAGPLVLMCFEDLGKGRDWHACHRRMFAEWWQEQTGQEVPELGRHPQGAKIQIPSAGQTPPVGPLSLF